MTTTTEPLKAEQQEGPPRQRLFNWLLLTIVFVGGLSSIGIELTASRLLGPYFGDSTIIWANLIGLTMLYLSIGYYFGGRVADRWPSATVLYCITAAAGFATGLIPFVSRPILERSLVAFQHLAVGAFYGSLLGVILLFAVPVTLLGFVSPFAIRLRVLSVRSAGNTAGSLYALSTLGSIAGSFLPVLVLIPWVGTYKTFYTLSLLLLLTSLLALTLLRARGPALGVLVLTAVVVAVAVFWKASAVRPPEYGEIVHEEESQYNYIQVVRQGTTYYLSLNEGHAVHSVYDPNRQLAGGPWDYFMVAPYFNPDTSPSDVRSMALIGLAAGTIPKQFTAAYGPIAIDGVEIDPAIVKVGRQYFDMNEPNLNVVVQDGRYFLTTTDRQYDLIGIDAYHQPYIPFHLTTQEFFQEVRDHLTPNGVAVVNAGRTATDFRLVDVIASTMKSVFPNVYIIDVGRYTNSIVIGTNQPTDIDNFERNIDRLPPGLIRTVGEVSLETGNIREWTSTDPKQVFTDDWAPVERVVDLIIIDTATGR
ncbi:MAG: fused MFS/spermidine synthase [Sphaerobacter sp.]|nr:fused MFS/spermidine synthase [Sphaerobacter sp.]